MNHDRYDINILKQLTRIANSLERLESKIPDASCIRFGECLSGGLYIGYSPRDGESLKEKFAKAMGKMEEEE